MEAEAGGSGGRGGAEAGGSGGKKEISHAIMSVLCHACLNLENIYILFQILLMLLGKIKTAALGVIINETFSYNILQ